MLHLQPCVPDDWPGFTIEYRLPSDGTRYTIQATNPHGDGRGVRAVQCDGRSLSVDDGTAHIPLARDGGSHRIDVVLGADAGMRR